MKKFLAVRRGIHRQLGVGVSLVFCALIAWLCGCATQPTDELIAQLLRDDGALLAEERPLPSSPEPTPAAGAPPAAAAAEAPPAVREAAAEERVATPADTGEEGRVTVQPETILQINVEEDPSLTGRYVVNDFSAIDFGYVGLVLLHEMTPEQAAAKIKSVLESRYMRRATVTVRISKASYDRVAVWGEVSRGGLIKIGPGTTISMADAILRAGGLKVGASSARVKVVRKGLLSPFQIADEGETYVFSEGGRPRVPDVSLSNNDIAFVYSFAAGPSGERKILLLGEVATPGVVRFSGDEPCTLLYLLFKIGGLPRFAKSDAIRIVRRDRSGVETEIRANADILLKEGRPEDDVPLENGDKVIVPARTISFF
jgi:protein involved in polysaccharide export with SLBB domain